MTTGTPPDQNTPNLKSWAANQLGVKPDAPAAEVRAAFLRRLADEEFVPSWRRQQAALYLARPTEETARRRLGHGQVQADEEDRLREEVDGFAADFFDLEVDERRRRFRELFASCAFCLPLTSRLRALAPGLDVTPLIDNNPLVTELAEDVLLMFTLRPEARIARRQALLRRVVAEPAPWQEAARQLTRTAPALAALVPGLMEEVMRGDRPRWRKTFKRPVVAATVSTGGGGSGSSGGGNPLRFSWILILVVVGIIRLLAAGVSSSPSRPSYQPPAFKSYDFQPPRYTLPPTMPRDGFDDEELRKIIKIHRATQRETPTGPPAPGSTERSRP